MYSRYCGTPQSIRLLTTLWHATVNTFTHDIGARQSQYVYSRHFGTPQSIRLLKTCWHATVNTFTHDIVARHSQYVYLRHWGTSKSIRVLTTSGYATVNSILTTFGYTTGLPSFLRIHGIAPYWGRVPSPAVVSSGRGVSDAVFMWCLGVPALACSTAHCLVTVTKVFYSCFVAILYCNLREV